LKKVLVTGSSGYIGSHLCQLLSRDYEVYGLDKDPPRVNYHKHFYNIDIREIIKVEQEFDAVVHLAALVNVGESELKPTAYYHTNVFGTINVITSIPTDNFIFASTGAAVNHKNVYGMSKRICEQMVAEQCKTYTTFRFYNVIGAEAVNPTNPDGLFYNLLKSAHTGKFTVYGTDYDTPDGTCVRDYVHVMEICQAIKRAVERPSNRIESLGHGQGHSVLQLVDMFQRVNKVNISVEHGSRRLGDEPISVLDDVSSYMEQMYSMEDLLKINLSLGDVK